MPMQVRKQRKHSRGYYVRRILADVWSHPANERARVRGVFRSIGWQVFKRATGRSIELPVFERSVARVYPDSTSGSNMIYFRRGYVDPGEMAFMRCYLRRGDHFLDLGANIGTYTLLAAELVGDTGHVYAFEPHPLSSERLRENIALNGLDDIATIFDVAVSDGDGEVQFLRDWDVSNRIAGSADDNKPTVAVRSATLDRVLRTDAAYAMAKLDVEGAEVHALRGASALMGAGNPPVWLVEVTRHLLEKMGTSEAELARVYADAGYRDVSRVCGADNVLASLPQFQRNNRLFVHEAHTEMVNDRVLGRVT